MPGLRLLRFCKDTYNDFRVDWIVLTACLVGLAVVILASAHAGEGALFANMGDFFVGDLDPNTSGI